MKVISEKISLYWKLIKSLQTGLLLATGLAGFMSFKCPVLNFPVLTGVAISLFLSISGSTVLNMWYDQDIDTKMKRTCFRPLASGRVSSREALLLGLVLSILGVGIGLLMDPLYALVIFLGIFFDVIIYTVWLKRRTCWSIIWGGLAGGMPVLAGRTLAVGSIDWIGILLAISILFWIPTHIMTFSMRYHDDYQAAGIPTFPSRYSFEFTRWMIAVSSVLAAFVMGFSIISIGISLGYLGVLISLSLVLVLLAIISLIKPSEKINLGLFKFASLYMIGAMLLIILI